MVPSEESPANLVPVIFRETSSAKTKNASFSGSQFPIALFGEGTATGSPYFLLCSFANFRTMS
jgi:hypothetical protein